MKISEALTAWQSDAAKFQARGIHVSAKSYLPDAYASSAKMAFDAQPGLVTSESNGVPSWFTAFISPEVLEILTAPIKGAEIVSEVQTGTWLTNEALFPVVERTGFVSSYGDYSSNGRTGVNQNFPARQNYLFQTLSEYGDREVALAGEARLNYVAELDKAAATVLGKFLNLTYHYGVQNLANYGLLNDPTIAANAAITPAVKAAGGNRWLTTGGAPNATANEVYNDFIALISALILQSNGLIEMDAPIKVVYSPQVQLALTFTNAYGVTVKAMLQQSFPKMTFTTDTLFGAQTATNQQGNAAGNLVMALVESVEGQSSGFVAFSERLRAHRIVPAASSFQQKKTSGSFGAVIRQGWAFSTMVGV